ncbi:hypothetical protein QQF64_009349 [Cirrhinus molitorella]|uniref:Secreted protein n=1 Tax=Cirrhinus molitorella TaxID=172907 RepID=A0ABR3M0X2_9TELE
MSWSSPHVCVRVCLFSVFSLSGCFTYAWEVLVNRSLPEGDRHRDGVCVCVASRPSLSGHWVSRRLRGVCEGREEVCIGWRAEC